MLANSSEQRAKNALQAMNENIFAFKKKFAEDAALGSVNFVSSSFPIRLGRRHHPPTNQTPSQ
jgi:hypothetical protein